MQNMETHAAAVLKRAAAYDRAARRYGRLHRRIQVQIGRLAGVRITAFLISGFSLLAGIYDERLDVYGPIALLAALVFGVAVWRHRAPYQLAPRVETLAKIAAESGARLLHVWEALPNDGARFLDAARPDLQELQVFGHASLFQVMNRTTLPAAERRLAELLRDGLDPDAVPERQAAAAELAPLRSLRGRLECEGRLVKVDDESLERFFEWAEQPTSTTWLKPAVALAIVLVPATLIQIGLTLALGYRTLWQLSFVMQLALWIGTTRRLTASYLPLIGDQRHRPFVALRRMFMLVERRRFRTPILKEMQARLGSGSDAPSARMGRLEAVLEALAVRHSALLYSVVSLGLMWEIFQGARLEAWRAAHGKRLRADVAALSDIEALAAIGGFAHDHAEFAWPTIDAQPDGPVLDAEGLGYPLFSPENRICNDFKVDAGGQLTLITGSNMSGKSSFMRAIGTNARLAFAGAPVCASRLRLIRCTLSTSIQITDAPDQGLSRFYAEVKRIAQILRDVEAAQTDPSALPRLYLVDEMLSGTNSRERHLASREITRRLVAAERSFGIVTTHDLALVTMADALPDAVKCYHFSDLFDGDALHFDYTLKAGVSTTTNALHVLAMEGVHIPAGPQPDITESTI